MRVLLNHSEFMNKLMYADLRSSVNWPFKSLISASSLFTWSTLHFFCTSISHICLRETQALGIIDA